MRIPLLIYVGTLALALSAQFAMGQQQPERPAGDLPGPIDSLQDLQDAGRMIFKLADTNNDGQISQQEAVNAGNLLVGGFFFSADKNGDGVLSQDEIRQAREEFLSQKPWLRYIVETIKTTPKVNAPAPAPTPGQPAVPEQPAAPGQPLTRSNSNPLAALATAFDTNNDKQLQASELRQAVQTTVQGIFATADINRDNQLSQSEVNAALAGAARTVAQAAFQQADIDNNGQISEAEWEKAILQPSRVVFRIMDLNHDGQLSQQEVQMARQVVMSKLRMLNLPEAPNSPRNMINSAIGNPTQPAQPVAAPVPATPTVPPGTSR